MGRCEDCGCRVDSGYCTNCHEEAYIHDIQTADMDMSFSNDFRGTVIEQREQIEERKKRVRS